MMISNKTVECWRVPQFSDGEDILKFPDFLHGVETRFTNSSMSFGDRLRVLLAAVPTCVSHQAQEVAENFCFRWGEQHNIADDDENVYDPNLPGMVFETPCRGIATRVTTEPDYGELRNIILKEVLGVEAEDSIERSIRSASQGNDRVELYISRFRGLVRLYFGVTGREEERGFLKVFLQGLRPDIKGLLRVGDIHTLESAYVAATEAARACNLLGTGRAPRPYLGTQRDPPQPSEGVQKIAVHPSRLHLFQQAGIFEGNQIFPNPSAEPTLHAAAGMLNKAGTPAEYLQLVANISGMELDETQCLVATREHLWGLHSGLVSAFAGAGAPGQIAEAIKLILPKRFLKVRQEARAPRPEPIQAVGLADGQMGDLRSMKNWGKQLKGELKHELKAQVDEVLNTVRDMLDGGGRKRRGADLDGASGEKPKISKMLCFKCNDEGHVAAECPNSGCGFCRQTGHAVRECAKLKQHVCPKCGEKGHSARWCQPRWCRSCGTEHSAKNGCPP